MKLPAYELKRARELVALRKEAMREAVRQCQTDRKAAKERSQALRRETMQSVRDGIERAKLSNREACHLRKTGTKERGRYRVGRGKEALLEEKRFQRELRRAEGRGRRQNAARTTAAERRQESDDEVRQNIDLELVALFNQVRRSIKGSPYQSRTEAFLQWAEENPGAVMRAQEELAERELRKLLREQRAMGGHAMKRTKRPKPTPEELAAVPF
jgi:hypothetical protein